MRNKSQGFTLVEIMIVVGILGVLFSIAVPHFVGRTQEARIKVAKIQIENLGMALDTFQLDCGRYPTTDEGLMALREPPTSLSGWKGPYLRKPVPLDPWKNNYIYTAPQRPTEDYQIRSYGPDHQEGNEDDIRS